VTLRDAIKEKAIKTFGQNRRMRIMRPSVTDDMIEKMDERRKWKNVKTEEGNIPGSEQRVTQINRYSTREM